MKTKKISLYVYLGLACVLLVGLLSVNWILNQQSINQKESSNGIILQKHLNEKWHYAQNIFLNPQLSQIIQKRDYKHPVLKSIEKQNFYMVCARNDSLYFWNSNQAICDTNLIHFNGDKGFITLVNVDYLVFQKTVGDFKCFLIYTVCDNSGNVRLPTDHPFYDDGTKFLIDNAKPGFTMQWSDGQNMAYFDLTEIGNTSIFWKLLNIILLVGVVFCALMFLYLNSRDVTSILWFNIHLWLFIGIFALLRTLLFKKYILQALQNTTLFDPEIYASTYLLNSLGDLILHVIFCYILFGAIRELKGSFIQKMVMFCKWPIILVFMLGYVFLVDMVFGIVKGLELDSVISFQFAEISKTNLYSYISLILIWFLIRGLFSVFKALVHWLKFVGYSIKEKLVMVSVVFFVYAIFQGLTGKEDGVSISLTLLFCTVLFGWPLALQKLKGVVLNSYLVLLISFFSAVILIYHHINREKEHLKSFEDKIINNQDDEAEERFRAIEQELSKEFISPQDFKDFFNQHDAYGKRIKNLYFSGYLDKYDLKILSFDSLGRSHRSNRRYSFGMLSQIYSSEAANTTSNHFYQIKNKGGLRGYLAKFENCNLLGSNGTVFLLLQPKIIQNAHSYPAFFEKKKQNYVFNLKEYSYALYFNSKLVSQKGDYPYILFLPKGKINTKDRHVFPKSNYIHTVSEPHNDLTVIISKPKDDIEKFSALIFFIIIFFILLGSANTLVLDTFNNLRLGIRNIREQESGDITLLKKLKGILGQLKLRSRNLSLRIQINMAGFVFIGLIVSVIVTIAIIRHNNNQKQEGQLVIKLKEVLNQFKNEPDLFKILVSEDRLRALVNQLSDANRIDLNVFDPSGKLLTSTQPGIYSQHLLATIMHPEALYELRNKNASHVLKDELVTNDEYLSGYVPVFDEGKEVKAYINLPYFIEKSEIDEEIEPLLVYLIISYFLLLIITSVIAVILGKYITKPIKAISSNLWNIKLTSKNEIIKWDGEDEIGELVKQYNKMVIELDESALKLRESERKGAWKEMALQVAHEIKNPLTPMKLNIQLLQRQWENNPSQIDANFKRITAIVIDQIDSLSRMASEFSSFAQMPSHQFEDCRVDDILLSTIHLFEHSENVEFVYSKTLAPAVVYADPDQIGRVFTNIIKNAIQSIAAENKGVITIDYGVQETEVQISIADNGEGMSEDVKSKIFVPSFSTKNSGMGLGLAISKKIIDNSKGQIWFTTIAGQGSIFTISLPLNGLDEN